jgi:hypothetical protein
MGITVIHRIGAVLLALTAALSIMATIAPSKAEATPHKPDVLQCKKLDKQSHTNRCKNRHPSGVRSVSHTRSPAPQAYPYRYSRTVWISWFNSHDNYRRCTADVTPPPGYQWGSYCYMIPAHR